MLMRGHKDIYEKGNQGSFVSQTYVSTSTIGKDGKRHKQDYF